MKAHNFEGMGPERDCLLRVVWKDSETAEWVHFTFHPADGEYTEDGLVGHPDQYQNDSGTLIYSYQDGMDPYDSRMAQWETGDGFVVTHWAELPEIDE